MPVALPDVNVLLALVDPAHEHHEAAHSWFAAAEPEGWATCPLTENGFVRVLSNPRYPGMPMRPGDAAALLRTFVLNCEANHRFWPDSVSLLDAALFDLDPVTGHQQTTDAYLLGLCERNGGTLTTFDRGIVSTVVRSARTDLLRHLSA